MKRHIATKTCSARNQTKKARVLREEQGFPRYSCSAMCNGVLYSPASHRYTRGQVEPLPPCAMVRFSVKCRKNSVRNERFLLPSTQAPKYFELLGEIPYRELRRETAAPDDEQGRRFLCLWYSQILESTAVENLGDNVSS